MKKLWLLSVFCFLLCGCAHQKQPNQLAYAISMSIDATDAGELEVAIQIPSIVSSSDDGSGSASYILLSASGATFAQALDVLQASSQRSVNLTQLKTVIFSSQLASRSDFSDILSDVQRTYQLFGGAALVVSMNPAKELLAAQKSVIGERLAQSVSQALLHYQEHGYAPRCTLSEVFFRIHSVYSDPVAILAATSNGSDFRAIAPDRMGDAYPGALPRTGPNLNEYYGAALFSRGQMVGLLNGWEESLRGLIAGESDTFTRSYQGCAVDFTVESRSVYVDTEDEGANICIWLDLLARPQREAPDLEGMRDILIRDIYALMEKCQLLETEPFGLADRAAAKFLTIPDWLAYDWPTRFSKANISVQIRIRA